MVAKSRIKRKDLWMGLNNINQSDWIKAAKKLGLRVVYSKSGTSHTVTLRDPNNLIDDNLNSLITTLQVNLYKEANRSIFKRIIDFGVSEDDLWEALGMV